MSEEKTPVVEETSAEIVEEPQEDGEGTVVDEKVIDICGDGSILKEILKEGEGDATPPAGAKVSVHYTGTLLDGSKFDSSRDRGQLFEFDLGMGRVIKGWDEGVATMKLGERAMFTIASDKAYGPSGSPPKIPPSATLKFDIELFKFNEYTDVSDGGDGTVQKKVLTKAPANNYQTPKDMAAVKVLYKIFTDAQTIVDQSQGEPASLFIDSGEQIVGLDKAIKSMRVGEKALFKVACELAYGAEGDATLGVPAAVDVKIEVTLVDLENPKATWSMTAEEKIQTGTGFKDAGNIFFKKADYGRAIRRYDSAIEAIGNTEEFQPEEVVSANKVLVSCHLNKSQCKLKESLFTAAIEDASQALEIDSNSVKALYRRASANNSMGNWKEAREDLAHALSIEPDNKGCTSLMKKVKGAEKKYNDKQKKLYSKMFQ
eukprot:m.84714 g.84714  ORF g.84714 m.84714 type:complete len:430 (-) comp12166_c0_seq1:115-1404(-)